MKFTPQNVNLRAACSSGTYKYSRKSHVQLHRVSTEVRKLPVTPGNQNESRQAFLTLRAGNGSA